MKPTLTLTAVLTSCAWLAGCGLFAPKDSAPDAGAAPSAPSAPAVQGLSFVSAQPFEGEITMTLVRPGKPEGRGYYDVKGAKVRIRSTPSVGGSTYVIADTSTWNVASISDPATTDAHRAATQKRPRPRQTAPDGEACGYLGRHARSLSFAERAWA
jgi:hypothetical protein